MTSKQTKTAIFGGSFDPVTFAHIDIVKNLEKKFDKVLVVPSFISPFKSGADDGKVRLALCKKLFSSDKTEVMRYEIAKKGVSYTVDTASYIAKREKDSKLFFVIGSEELTRLTEWHDIDRLKTYVTFYVVPRPDHAVSDALLGTLKKRKIKIKFATFDGADISSTQVKLDIAFGKTNKYVPDAVWKYVSQGYFDPYGKYVKKLFEYGLDNRRIEHTYRTAIRGAYLAKLYGANVADAAVACILHDIAKSVDAAEYKDKTDIDGYPEPTVHAPIGAYIAKKEFGVSEDIYNAIRLHSTADENMTLLDEIVYLADKTECGRSYRSLDLMLKLCAADKNVAMLEALKEIGELEKTDACEMSARALAYYKKLCGAIDIVAVASSALPSVVNSTSTAIKPVIQKSKAVASAEKRSAEMAKVTEKSKAVRVYEPSGELSDIKKIAVAVADELCKHKARDVDIVDLDGKTIVADYFVISSASSTTAVKALMNYVEDRLTKQFGIDPIKRDVDREWVALDYGGVIVHIFTDKMREFYNIERLWSDGNNIERYDV